MKLNELKHNHSLTDLLKILIFSILMITPLLSVATRCLYVICNKNAYQSYDGEEITETIYVDQNRTYENIRYNLYVGDLQGITETKLYITNYEWVNTGTISQTTINTINNRIDDIMLLGMNENEPNIINLYTLSANNNTIYLAAISTSTNAVISFNTSTAKNNITQYLYYYETNDYTKLDNVFEYSINELEQSPIINWTANTAVYTGVNAMTSQLNITGSVIPMLITYWFLLTIIYVIIDIVLKLFTTLTHLIGAKTSN